MHILNISPLSDVGLLKIFSQFVGFRFFLLTVPYTLQKLCNFMRSHLTFLDLRASAMGVLIRKIFQVNMYSRVFSSFFSISFILSGFTRRFLIHLDLSFEQGDKNGSVCILLHADFQLNHHHLLKMLSFFHWMVLAPLSKIKRP